jgi:hypothetical protein
MTLKDLDESIREAKRYLDRCKDLKVRAESGFGIGWASKESGAVKRASMDLSRVLTKIRR